MKDSSNKKLILITMMILVCLLAFYKTVKHYNSIEREPIIKNSINVADTKENETNLGDVANCAVMKKTCGDWVCGTSAINCGTAGGSGSMECRSHGLNCSTCYIEKKATNECETCNSGYTLENGQCIKNDNCAITTINNKAYVAENDTYSVTYSLQNCSYNNPDVVVDNGTLDRIVPYQYTGGTVFVKAGSCGATTVTISINGTSMTSTIEVKGEWISSSVCVKKEDALYTTKTEADQHGSDTYYVGWDKERECYTTAYSRSCSGTYTPPVTETPACYANASLLSTATDAKWGVESTAKTTGRTYLISWVKSESDCKVTAKPGSLCEPQPTVCTKSENNTSICEEKHEMTYNDGLSCSGQSFYNISCSNKVTTYFDHNDDGDVTGQTKNLYVGMGFKFGIVIRSERECTATFNKENWKQAYDLTQAKINQATKEKSYVSDSQLDSLIYEMENKKTKLKEMVTSYNNFDPTASYNETAAIALKYLVNKKTVNAKANFISQVVNDGKGSYSNKSVVNLGISGVNNPSNYKWSNKGNSRVIKLILPKATIGGLDGGNKLYLDYYVDPGTYNLNVTVSGVGCNSTIKNDKCQIKVSEQEILYRPIDVSNPFINSKWTPGVNWINTKFDFRNIIHADIWNS